ncbi:hypothetical protein HQ520_11105, partial [bacterium]|nr:hypothetical protein [bacterium]
MRTLPRLTLFLLLLSMIFFGGERTSCASPPDVYDLFHQDQTSTTLNNIGLNTPQTHALYVAQDEDWAVFHAQAGLPYSIKITAVAPGIDPALEVFIANPNASGETRDFAAEGGDETYSRVNWPQTGPVWVRVHGTGSFSGATSYTLTVTGDWGANLGLATISGFASTFAYAQGGRLQLPETLPQADTSPVPP